MVSIEGLCLNCMTPVDGEKGCECGLNNIGVANAENQARIGSTLADRYVVGRAILENAEGIRYIGFDTEKGLRVMIREYFPAAICARDSEGLIVCRQEAQVQYKSLLEEFLDTSRKLKSLNHLAGITHVIDIFMQNGTVYAIYEHLNAAPLQDYLELKPGQMPWQDAVKLMLPFLGTIAAVHKAGLLHRGISPETVYITDTGELVLFGFSLESLRTEFSEISPELFEGYSAPEQYLANGRQGTWTDVYAVAALMYRLLAGVSPAPADKRQEGGLVTPAAELNKTVDNKASAAISNALEVSFASRTKTVEEFELDLIMQESYDTNVYKVAPREGDASSQAKRKPRHGAARIMILSLLVLMLLVGASLTVFFLQKNKPQDNSGTVTLQDFRGKFSQEVVNSGAYTGLYEFVVQQAFSDTVPKDVIISQVPSAGTTVEKGSQVTLTVSLGSDLILVPELQGMTALDAVRMLEDMEINYQIIESTNQQDLPGMVVKTTPASNSNFHKSTDTLIVIVGAADNSVAPEESSAPESSSNPSSSSQATSGSSSVSSASSAPGLGQSGVQFDNPGFSSSEHSSNESN